jgi:hypothetical protein
MRATGWVLVFASSNSNHSIRAGSRAVLTLMAEWQAMEAAIRVRRAGKILILLGFVGIGADCSITSPASAPAAPSRPTGAALTASVCGPKGSTSKPLRFQLLGDARKNHHLPGLQLHQQGHQ